MSSFRESDVEDALLDQLKNLGYTCLDNHFSGPDGLHSERQSWSEVILTRRLQQAIDRLNPRIPPDSRADALRKFIATEKPSLVEENRRLHRALTEGIAVEFHDKYGAIRGDNVRLIDFNDPDNNDWLAISQFTVIENGNNRRPDVVLFINGLPLAVFELKNPGDEAATLLGARNQLQTYKDEIPSLFRTNAVLVTSDGLRARIGSLTASEARFMPWHTLDSSKLAPKEMPEMQVLTEGVFEKRRFLDLIRNFTLFADDGSGIEKIIAGYHQFHAVQRAVEKTVSASQPQGDRKIGVIWHTQGSGKSLLMAFYAGQLVQHPQLKNPTIIVVTDRNDLDNQLFATFSRCSDMIRQTPIQVENRKQLQKLLKRPSGGVIFTTIQKFSPEKGETKYPLLSKRRNITVIVDEAHRSQYGFEAKMQQQSGALGYGFAKHLRDALPAASFIGFTGTPIEKEDRNTPAVFGDYIDIYDISRGVKDGVTLPIHYESRLARIRLAEDEKPQIDAEIETLTENEAITEQEKRKWSAIEALVGAEKRLQMVAEDLVAHFQNRLEAMDGKAMVVCLSRRICIDLYDKITALRPDWHSDDDSEGDIKIVMTGSAADPLPWQNHIRNKMRRDYLANRIKDPSDPLKLVLVCDMWLTGFDVPPLHTMYIDKPMKGHNLMQAIARVNRVFREKQGGLVVDYIGIAQRLKQALGQYTAADQKQVGIDESEAVAVMCEKYDVVRVMFHGFDYQRALQGTNQERLNVIAEAMEWILAKQHAAAAKENTESDKKRARRRFQDAALALSRAFTLAAASDAARQIRDEVGFFATVRTALIKSTPESEKTAADRQMALRQIIDRAVVSTEIVNILQLAGLSSPDISILSDEFLAEIQQMETRNLALEALKKLLNDEITSRRRFNMVEAKKFSERLAESMARYHANAISTVEVLQELIELAREIRAARKRGEEEGLSTAEIAFYDALAENDSAVQIMGNDTLKMIAHELMAGIKNNISVDWSRKESARARMRLLVRHILRRHGYPPDLQDSAVQTVLQQTEIWSHRWTADLPTPPHQEFLLAADSTPPPTPHIPPHPL